MPKTCQINRWAIIDDKGTIYDGHEDEMTSLFNAIIKDESDPDLTWDGDLKLIEIHQAYK